VLDEYCLILEDTEGWQVT